MLSHILALELERGWKKNGKSFAMNVEQRKDALNFFIRRRRDFILETTGADSSRLACTKSL